MRTITMAGTEHKQNIVRFNVFLMRALIAGSLNLCSCVVLEYQSHLSNRVTGEGVGGSDYCQLETLQARCRWNSEVIVMTSARWGRMKASRCLSVHPNVLTALGGDPLFLGCSQDVLAVLDRKCSGRSECDVRIPDSDLDDVKPCYQDLKSYLEASYECVRVVQESRSCAVSATTHAQFISSSVSASTPQSSHNTSSSSSSCGAVSHPLRLEAAAGQRINISLIDFAASAADRSGPSRDVIADGEVTSRCRQYGYVVEKSSKKNVSLCVDGGAEQREKTVYTSENNAVVVVLPLPQPTGNGRHNFLIKVQAVGCTNIVPPDNAWLKRSNNDIIIGCYSSQQTWRLQCDGHNWKGTVGTCQELYVGSVLIPNAPDEEIEITAPRRVSAVALGAMFAVACTTVLVCLSVVCIGYYCLRRRSSSSSSDDDLLKNIDLFQARQQREADGSSAVGSRSESRVTTAPNSRNVSTLSTPVLASRRSSERILANTRPSLGSLHNV